MLVCNELFFLPDSPPIPAGDQLATPAVQYPPMSLNPFSNPRPRPVGFGAILSTDQARGDSLNDMSFEDVSHARKHLIDSWIEDAKTVLKFVSLIQLILCLLSYSFCLKERRFHSNSCIIYNRKLQIVITRYRTPNLTTTFTASRRFNYHC